MSIFAHSIHLPAKLLAYILSNLQKVVWNNTSIPPKELIQLFPLLLGRILKVIYALNTIKTSEFSTTFPSVLYFS